jgi:arylsulfatase A-like enzyme
VFRAEPTLPGLLRAAGYDTCAVSNNQYIRPTTGFARGFDTFEMPAGRTAPRQFADLFGPVVNRVASSPVRYGFERLLDISRARDGLTTSPASHTTSPASHTTSPASHTTSPASASGNSLVDSVGGLIDTVSAPFFLFVNLFGAHLPRSPAPEHVDRFVDDSLADVPVVTNERAHRSGTGMDERGFERMRQLYDADLRTVDDRLEALLDRLSAAGVLEESLVVVVSDHGEHLGEFGLVGHQHSVFEPVVSVPLAARFPDGGPDRVTDPVETRRVFHTVLDESGVESYPEQSLSSGQGQAVTRGAFYTPMVDVTALTWEGNLRHDRRLLGETLSFARTGGHKLVRFDGGEWLFPLPEDGGVSLSRENGRQAYERLTGEMP